MTDRDEVQVVRGPTPPQASNAPVFSVTLENGYIVTSPNQFGNGDVAAMNARPEPRPLPSW